VKVRKAIITAAGWGTRFLPITKAQPKEMLPLVDKPLIQHSVEEAINSGIEQIILITALGKRAIEDYFDRSFELEYFLERKGETKRLQEVRVLLPDDIVDSQVPVLKQMIEVYEQYQTNIVAVECVSRQDTIKYGIIEPKKISGHIYQVLSLAEKPEPAQAPSNLGVVGRYILMPQIFDVLEVTPPGKNQEIQLTDALQLLLKQQSILAYEFEGVRYDTGTPLGWLKATIAFALKHPDIGQELREYLQQLL